MLWVYYGNDTTEVRRAALLAFDEVVRTGARVERLEAGTWGVGKIADMVGATSLFGEATVYVVDTPSEDPEWYAALLAARAECAASANTIIVIEGVLNAADKRAWATAATIMAESTRGAEKPLDVFALGTAVCNRDKKTLWMVATTLRQHGVPAEEQIGILWWQLKTLRLVAQSPTAAAADMKPFVYDKAKRAARLYTVAELEGLSRRLLRVYHDGHGGVRDIDRGLEEWVLTI